jgi:hypothetical protein
MRVAELQMPVFLEHLASIWVPKLEEACYSKVPKVDAAVDALFFFVSVCI